MSDHEFEKQVRQKLNDLRLTPSAEAWEKIEQGLKRKRRIPLLWIPVFLLGLVAGGYLIFNQTSTDSREQITKQETLPGKQSIVKKDQPSQPASAAPDGPSVKKTEKSNNANEEISTPVISPEKKTTTNTQRPATGKFDKVAAPKPNLTPEQLPSKRSISESGSTNEMGTPVTGSENTIAQKLMRYYSTLPGVTPQGFDRNAFTQTTTPKNNYAFLQQPPAAKPKINFTQKWAFGIHASAGISAVNEGTFLDFSRKAMVEDVAYRPAFANVAAAPTYTPSRLTPGFNYSMGVNVKRDLSQRFSITASLNYLQLNTKNKVGQKVYGNQVVNNGTRGYINIQNFYTLDPPDQASDYKNRYHFVELPLSLNTRLNRSKKLPFYWNAGFSYTRLLSSNSLHFDGTTGVYYKNDKLINQNQVAFTTGFHVSLFNKKYPLWIGPTGRYYLTRQLQKDVSSNKNFMSAGLDVKLYLR